MYAPLWGVPEDPATGSAAAALAGLLATTDASDDGWHSWRIEQGIEMKRPSLIRARALREGGRVAEVRVAGGAVLVAEGTIHVPQRTSEGGAGYAAA
jgi:trans-2,3-dihydro-3-hydroxyanthranilate isomerase